MIKNSIRMHGRGARRAGGALVIALILSVFMAGLAAALLGTNLSTGKARASTEVAQDCFYAAEAGLSDAYARLSAGRTGEARSGVCRSGASAGDPLALRSDCTMRFSASRV